MTISVKKTMGKKMNNGFKGSSNKVSITRYVANVCLKRLVLMASVFLILLGHINTVNAQTQTMQFGYVAEAVFSLDGNPIYSEDQEELATRACQNYVQNLNANRSPNAVEGTGIHTDHGIAKGRNPITGMDGYFCQISVTVLDFDDRGVPFITDFEISGNERPGSRDFPARRNFCTSRYPTSLDADEMFKHYDAVDDQGCACDGVGWEDTEKNGGEGCFKTEEQDPDEEKDNGDPCENGEGNPCNVATGNKYQIETDIVRHARQLELVRAYNSRNLSDRGFGKGWTANHHKRLKITSSDRIAVIRDNGRGEPWRRESGIWQGDTDSDLILEQTASGFTLLKNDGSQERYDASGKLLADIDAQGKRLDYAYNSDNQLTRITDHFGHVLQLAYVDGRVSSVTDSLGDVYAYAYDANDNLISITYPDTTPNDDSDNPQRVYHYENADYPNHLTGITDENGDRYASFAYDDNGKTILSEHAQTNNNVPQQRFRFSYDEENKQTVVTDAIGTQQVWRFDENLGVHNLIEKLNLSDNKAITKTYDARNNVVSYTDEEGRTTTYGYNASNQRTSMTEAVGTFESRVTTYQYVSSDIDLVTRMTEQSVASLEQRKETLISYDAELNITSVVINGFSQGFNTVTRHFDYDYDDLGRVIRAYRAHAGVGLNGEEPERTFTEFEYYNCTTGHECGQLQRATNALRHTSTYDAYDANGRLTQMTDPNGTVTAYTYHPRGWLLSVTQVPVDGETRVTQYSYDPLGQILTITTPDAIVLSYVYDKAHDLRSIRDNLGNKIEYAYDAKGNRTQENTIDPDGTLSKTLHRDYDVRNFISSINADGSVTQIINDAVGNLTEITDPNLNPSTQNRYDALDRLQQTIDALSNQTNYQYNVADQLIKVRSPNGSTTDYVYDDLGNLLEEQSSDRGTLTYTHDAVGNVLSVTDGRGVTANYRYDVLNRLTGVEYANADENINYHYDGTPTDELGNESDACGFGVGRLCQISDPSGQTNYAYDAWGNVLVHQKQEVTQFDSAENDAQNYVVRYAYDQANRVIQQTNPNGLQIDYARDAIGRIDGIAVTHQGVTQSLLSNRTYRADGLAFGHTLGNGLQDSRQYDLQGRLTEQTLGGLFSKTYAYDANSNVLAQDTTPDATLKDTFQLNGFADPSYTYDVLNRIVEENSTLGNLVFQYDGNGNRLSKTRNGNDRLYSYVDPTQVDPPITDVPAILNEYSLILAQFPSVASVAPTALSELESILTQFGVGTGNNQQIILQFAQGSWFLDSEIEFDIVNQLINALFNLLEGEPAETSNRVLSVNSKAITYDSSGNIVSDKDGKRLYTYNQRNQLHTFTKDGQLRAQYQYNSNRQRTQKQFYKKLQDGETQATTRTFHFQYDVYGNLISEYISNKNGVYKLRRTYIWLANEPVAQINFNGNGSIKHITYITTDHLNTPRIGTDETGAIVWRWDSDAFGQAQPNKDPDFNNSNRNIRLRFPGQYYDQETGLYYSWHRYYDPTTGRFITSDPLGLYDGPNTYVYVGANPVNYYDPTGLAKDSITSRIESMIIRGDQRGLQNFLNSGGLNPAQTQIARQGLARLNKIKHIFDKKAHKLDDFVEACGDQSKAFDNLNDAFKQLAKDRQDGLIRDAVVKVRGFEITVRGAVVDGVPKISTAFIP